MSDNRNIINALPLVADALGRKYGVKVLIGGSKAYTNGRDIHIPALPLDADENVLNLARGFLDHEAAHLRITKFDALKAANLSGMEKHVWNIIEDYMVEKELAEIYPGCSQNFQWLIRHLFLNKNDASTETGDTSPNIIFNWLLLNMRATVVPELGVVRDHLAVEMDKFYPALRQRLEPLVATIPSTCFNTHDCIEMTRKIVAVLMEYAKSQETDNGKESSTGTDDPEELPDCPSRRATPEPASSRTGMESTKNVSDTGNNRSLTEDGQQWQSNASARIPEFSSIEDNSKEQPIEMLKEILVDNAALPDQDIGGMAGSLLEGINQGNQYRQLAVAVKKPVMGLAFSNAELTEIRKTTTALRTRMAALLQTQILAENRIGRNGRIDTRRIARLAAGDVKIFARHGVKQGISSAVHILLDASSSMRSNDRISLACRACYAVAEALQNVPGAGVAVTSFPNGLYEHGGKDDPHWATVGSILAHRQKLHSRFKVSANGGTPMAEAVWWIIQQMCLLKESRKLLLILSDGEPDNVNETVNALDACRAHGIEVYGLGIQTSAMLRFLPQNQAHALYDINELAPAIFGLLREKLINRKGVTNENAV